MNIFITGASGFLGSHLCRHLRADGHQLTTPTSREADLRHANSLALFNSTAFDQIWHLAAWTQAGDFCLHHPGEQWLINQSINTHVLAWWHERQPQAKLIAMGSSCCYPPEAPLVEENFDLGRPTESLYTYAMTKRMLVAGLRALHQQYGHRYLVLVPSTLYGAGYHLDGRQMHFIFDLMRKILDARENGGEVTLWGDGHQRRELIHVEDFVRAAVHLAACHGNDLVNIGGGEEFEIRWYAERLCAMVGLDPARVRYDTTRYVGVRSKMLDIRKLRAVMPDFHPLPLEEGLRQTMDWFQKARARP